MNKPPNVPADLWQILPQSEKDQTSQEDGGFLGLIMSGPFKCHYFTLWDTDGQPFALYDKSSGQWKKEAFPAQAKQP